MLPLCSTSSSHYHHQVLFPAGLRGNAVGRRGIAGTTHTLPSQLPFKTQVTQRSDCMEFNHQDVLDNIQLLPSNNWPHSMEAVINTYPSFTKDMLLPVSDQIASASLDDASFTDLKPGMENFFSAVSCSIDASVAKGYLLFKNTLDAITSPISASIQSASDALNNGVSGFLSSTDHSAQLVGNRLTGFSVDLKDSLTQVGAVSIDVLRRTTITLEDYFASGASLVLYYYGSAKELFPPEVRDVLNLTENKASAFLGPLAAVFKQVYTAIELLETNIGLDPNDPLVPLAFFLGSSAILGVSYRVLVYGGYSGDLSPQSTLALLKGENNVVLIDIRPEDLRARDGVPDLRRGARVKYASIVLPEIDGSVRKLMKTERDLIDMLAAAVIRNLKIVQDRSKVIVLDADGTRSKSIARSLRKLGIKKPYLVQGGFQSWVKNGLCIKELKPETTFSVLNEEAEAILEDIRPTPVKIVGYALGFIAASYALSEWEKTLQFVGIIGLGQTIYRRIAAYEDSEEFRQDVRLLLGPFRVGAGAISWAAGKLEPNRIGLPTSPSSTDVQSRVQQAAAKHESQPSATEEAQELSVSTNETAGPSES